MLQEGKQGDRLGRGQIGRKKSNRAREVAMAADWLVQQGRDPLLIIGQIILDLKKKYAAYMLKEVPDIAKIMCQLVAWNLVHAHLTT